MEFFSVRSAYYMQYEMAAGSSAGCSYSAVRREVWKGIWELDDPNVEKNFIWRACHDILPTRANLFKRKILTDPLCLFCGAEAET